MTLLNIQVYKAMALIRWMLMLFIMGTTEFTFGADLDFPERYAALECQDDHIFVIVNFYPHKIFKLSWGIDDELIKADIPVSQISTEKLEMYSGEGVHLQLPREFGRDSHAIRIGTLQTMSKPQAKYDGLRCILHGAD